MNLQLIEKIASVLLALLKVLIEQLQRDNEEEAKADRDLAQAMRNKTNNMLTDDEIIDRV